MFVVYDCFLAWLLCVMLLFYFTYCNPTPVGTPCLGNLLFSNVSVSMSTPIPLLSTPSDRRGYERVVRRWKRANPRVASRNWKRRNPNVEKMEVDPMETPADFSSVVLKDFFGSVLFPISKYFNSCTLLPFNQSDLGLWSRLSFI